MGQDVARIRGEAQEVYGVLDTSGCTSKRFNVAFAQYTNPITYRYYTVDTPPGDLGYVNLGVLKADVYWSVQIQGTCTPYVYTDSIQNFSPPSKLTADATNPAYVYKGAPATYSFYNSAPTVNYRLDWGDGGSESWRGVSGQPTRTFNHTYNQAGTYTIGTVATGTSYTAPTRTSTVTILDPTIRVPQGYQTESLSVTPVVVKDLMPGSTHTVAWGDGSSESFTVPGGAPQEFLLRHTYVKDGTYTVSVTTAPTVSPIQVTLKTPPPQLSVTGTALQADLSLRLLQGDTDYTIDWGDSQTTALPRTVSGVCCAPIVQSHAYSAPGTYTINVYGPTSPTTTGILSTIAYTATLGAVTLSASPQQPLAGQQVVLTLSGLEPGATYDVNWGDGTVETGITGQTSTTRSHAYAAAQDYTITVTNGGQTLGTTTVAVQVPAPVLSHTQQGLTVTLQVQNLVTGAAYTVNWGEGTPEPLTATGPATTLTHAYARPGAYTVTVTPTRGAAASEAVSVTASPPRLTITPPVVDTDQAVTAAMADLIATLQYTLDWKDGTAPVTFTATGTQATQTHTFAAPGTYQVELTTPGVNPTTAPATVRPGAPILALTADTLTATLNASRLLTGVSYTIDWGAGVTERLTATGPAMTFTHTYSAPGTQTVTVTPDGGTAATATVTLSVPTPTLNVTPAQGLTDTAFTATLGNLVPT
ncbi:PKD domain-containing protein, partial [Deinococcus sedimenti]|uniref:PKD domain-containing protein n=1 Tax=Deinococcus sedimenti TaxID=1867090 RepID=UPI001E49BBC5